MTEFLSVEQVIAIHEATVLQDGGLAGIRDIGLLISAVEVPKGKMFGEDFYPTIYDKAAAYLYHIVRSHPFNDGNERTGFSATLLFLKANDVLIEFDHKEYENLVVEVAEGKVTKEQIARFLEHGKV